MPVSSTKKHTKKYKNTTKQGKQGKQNKQSKQSKPGKKGKKSKKSNRKYKKSYKNKYKTQKGGFYYGTAIIENKNNNMKQMFDEHFNSLLKNNMVIIEPLGKSDGVYGKILLVKCKDEYLRSIKQEDFAIRDYFGNPCKRILLKIAWIHDSDGWNEKEWGNNISVTDAAFKREVDIQKHVFKTTNTNLQPITPLIYQDMILDPNQSEQFLRLIFNNAAGGEEAQQKINNINEARIAFEQPKDNGGVGDNSRVSLGVIFMEMRDGYSTLEDKVESENIVMNNNYMLGMISEVLNRLHNNCKVKHWDLHTENILINIEEYGYYSPNQGNILLIDWGKSSFHQFGIPGATPEINPYNDAQIEQDPNEKWHYNHWAYRWLNIPGIQYPPPPPPKKIDVWWNIRDWGNDWQSAETKSYAEHLRTARRNNPPKQLLSVVNFYQPGNVNCQMKRVCDSSGGVEPAQAAPAQAVPVWNPYASTQAPAAAPAQAAPVWNPFGSTQVQAAPVQRMGAFDRNPNQPAPRF